MLAAGLSVREIARIEDKNYRSVYDSIEGAKKKFLGQHRIYRKNIGFKRKTPDK